MEPAIHDFGILTPCHVTELVPSPGRNTNKPVLVVRRDARGARRTGPPHPTATLVFVRMLGAMTGAIAPGAVGPNPAGGALTGTAVGITLAIAVAAVGVVGAQVGARERHEQ